MIKRKQVFRKNTNKKCKAFIISQKDIKIMIVQIQYFKFYKIMAKQMNAYNMRNLLKDMIQLLFIILIKKNIKKH